ncbi:MAG TPA: 7-carboxy-7-deazaguanine synthase QueE [Brumimicrobium sp.]|nr:7-carboxy-7-deazaguanine synthase QueE [Brumimicrobium sp.]
MKTNQDPIRTSWPIMESFYTIQGEGHYSGRAAYFIRVAGCDVGCVWCDVKESWEAGAHPIVSLEQLLKEVAETPTDFVVLTGGEPTMYSLISLVQALQEIGKEVAIETSGTNDLDVELDWYCFSPKKFKKPVAEAYAKANELKIVVFNQSDFEWAEGHAKMVNEDCLLYLQPEWSKEAQMLPLIIEYVKNNPKWRVSLQTHKYMNIP